MKQVSRDFFLFLSKNKTLNRGAKKWGLKLGASKVVAGVTIDSAMKTVKSLNERGLMCTVDHLGEFVTESKEAEEAADCCMETINAMAEYGVDCHLSLKLTQLGLDIDEKLCLDNMRNILSTAEKHRNFVNIDMEDYSHYQQTLNLLKELHEDYDNVGTVLQAYLHRAETDLEHLKGVPLRLVKGAYKESAEVAFQDKEDINANFLALIEKHLLNGSYTAIATHDHYIIEKVKEFVDIHNIPKDLFEFQMLYGFRNELQEQLVNEGYRFRTYVPFGNDWYGYFMRRLAERPQNVAFAFKGFFSK
ncbi:proline dehydrogenase family protein [Alteribacillus bidgolensis]|uniref:proline dehydrogenase n=1 Tax=Alteribacillus bidgolensis TaxID=930129 RepID=A0A1G8K5P8_9BACI|nr:proline dehydrogenase [Alteribacillus bidgolensis]SDI38679.1 L-proline dehydrogenase [Alteribacillus bidgolensis]